MTPRERQSVTELFDRLASLESTPRDRDAEQAIAEGLRRAPNAAYALVQTVLVQDEALKRADARIRDLEGGLGEQAPGGFLDNMRTKLFGREDGPRGSVPPVSSASKWNNGQAGAAPLAQPMQTGGSSFLGTAASAAAGVIGGSLLFDGIRSLMGGHHGSAFAGSDGGSPWTSDASGSNLARDAGIDDIGAGRASSFDDSGRAGFAGVPDDGMDDDIAVDDGGDFSGGDITDA